MTVSSGSPAILPPTIESWIAADRALDADRMRDLMAPAIVLASPLTDAFDFTGPAKAASALARMPAMQLHLAEKQVMPRLRPRD